MASNYALMMDALRIYREAMRKFIMGKLQEAYKDLWWPQGVAKHFKAEELERLNEIFKSRTVKKSAVPTNVREMADMLDIAHFRTIIEANWRQVFKEALGDKTVLDGWIAEVTSARNALAPLGPAATSTARWRCASSTPAASSSIRSTSRRRGKYRTSGTPSTKGRVPRP
jgi:hypothetical protein